MEALYKEMQERLNYLQQQEESVENTYRIRELTLAIVRVQQLLLLSTPSPVEGEKEELRKRFEGHFYNTELEPFTEFKNTDVFDFFYSEILSRENANTILKGALQYQREKTEAQASRIKALEGEAKDDNYVISILTEQVKALEERLEKVAYFKSVPVAPPHEDKGAEEYFNGINDLRLIKWEGLSDERKRARAIKCMQEYASNERKRAIQECIDDLNKHHNSLPAVSSDSDNGYSLGVTSCVNILCMKLKT